MVRIARALLVVTVLGLLSNSVRAIEPKLLPSDTEIIFTVNLKQILDSEIVKANKEVVKQLQGALDSQLPADAKKYLEKIGVDPFKDIDSVTVAHPGTKDPEAGVVIIEGAFNQEKLESAAEDAVKEFGEVLKISKVGNVKVYDVTAPGEKRMFLSLMGRNLVMTSREKLMGAAIERSGGTRQGKLKKQIGELLDTTNDKQSINFVVTGAALLKLSENAPIPNGDKVGPALQAIDGISGAITIAKNVNFQFALAGKDAKTAKDFVAQGNAGLIAIRILAASKAKENEQLMPLVDVANSLRIQARGTNTVLTGEISYENIEKLVKAFGKGAPLP